MTASLTASLTARQPLLTPSRRSPRHEGLTRGPEGKAPGVAAGSAGEGRGRAVAPPASDTTESEVPTAFDWSPLMNVVVPRAVTAVQPEAKIALRLGVDEETRAGPMMKGCATTRITSTSTPDRSLRRRPTHRRIG